MPKERPKPEEMSKYQRYYWSRRDDPEFREKNNKRMREYQAQHREAVRHQDYKKRYGITFEEYLVLFEGQGGVCAICQEPEIRVRQGTICSLCVDHNHRTGRVRALLCTKCNTMVGMARERPDVLAEALNYLRVDEELELVETE